MLLEGVELFRVTNVDEQELEDGTKLRTVTLAYKPGVGELARAAKTASELQRMAAAEPTDRVELTGAALDSFIERMLGDRIGSGVAPTAPTRRSECGSMSYPCRDAPRRIVPLVEDT